MAGTVRQGYEGLVQSARAELGKRGGGVRTWIQVGSATCENAAGAREVEAEFRKHLAAAGRSDIGIRMTGCTGRCSREPIVGILASGAMPVTYERVDRELVHRLFTSHVVGGVPVLDHVLDGADPAAPLPACELLVCSGGRCGRKAGPGGIGESFRARLAATGLDAARARVSDANCVGLCPEGEEGLASFVFVRPEGFLYRVATGQDVDEIVASHVVRGKPVERLRLEQRGASNRFFSLYGGSAFFKRQTRVALRNAGIVDPESLEEYLLHDGYAALATVLERQDPAWVIDTISASRLRGRGGGGYPTGTKWAAARKSPGEVKYIICNADEGDPGAFMDRSMLEGDPFSVVEGMTIGAYAIGAHRGFVYVRAEYPMAIDRLEKAISQCRRAGLLGSDLLGSGFGFDLEIRLGAGAFVCGEETALIQSIEGERGQPRPRPPYPSESGLWGKPTVINNVETFANIPAVIDYGAEWFRALGTEKSGGTKVFALAGKVKHTGLVEVPMGTSLRQIVFEVGGGVPGGKQAKAIQTGGPAGGCIPSAWFDTPVDFDTLSKAGSIMGSGGMIVMDEDDCMVDIAKFFLTFSQDESCGKCTPCREGTKRMLEILERITAGTGVPEDLTKLERLGKLMRKSSLCGLGRAAANPVLSTLVHFREEYEAHVRDRRCPSRRCVALIRYEIDAEKCVGCTACARNCPSSCIVGSAKKPHVIDQSRCVKCGRCHTVCRFAAVVRT